MLKQFVFALAIVAVVTSSSFAGTIYNFATFRSGLPGWENADLQFSVEVGDAGTAASGNKLVSFLFSNNSTVESVVKEIFFDDGTLLQIPGQTAIGNGDGGNGAAGGDVKFVENHGINFPGGNLIEWDTSGGFSTSLDGENPSGLNKHGIDMGETLEVIFELQATKTLQDTLDAMDLSLLPDNRNHDIVGGLRIGLHVGSFGPTNGYSDSFVNVPEDENNGPGSGGFNPVPEPTSALVWGLIGLTGISARRKRIAKS